MPLQLPVQAPSLLHRPIYKKAGITKKEKSPAAMQQPKSPAVALPMHLRFVFPPNYGIFVHKHFSSWQKNLYTSSSASNNRCSASARHSSLGKWPGTSTSGFGPSWCATKIWLCSWGKARRLVISKNSNSTCQNTKASYIWSQMPEALANWCPNTAIPSIISCCSTKLQVFSKAHSSPSNSKK